MGGGKPRNLQEAVGLTLGRRKGDWPVSIAETACAVRAMMPGCDLTDDELADMIAIAAMERGLSVTFDRDLLSEDKRGLAFS